jgi:hypothetical protein
MTSNRYNHSSCTIRSSDLQRAWVYTICGLSFFDDTYFDESPFYVNFIERLEIDINNRGRAVNK